MYTIYPTLNICNKFSPLIPAPSGVCQKARDANLTLNQPAFQINAMQWGGVGRGRGGLLGRPPVIYVQQISTENNSLTDLSCGTLETYRPQPWLYR